MWVIWALIATLCWGVWAVLSGLAQKQGTALGLVTGIFIIETLFLLPFVGQVKQSLSWALVGAAFFGSAAYAAYFMALESGGPAGSVVAVTALYPAIAAVLAVYVLHEGITVQKAVGLVLAIIAIILITAK
jgi:bacterial/archaeal transporter family protein